MALAKKVEQQKKPAQPKRGRRTALNMRERRVKDVEGREYSLRVRPYRPVDNKIDGAVITLVELEEKRESYADKTSNCAKQRPQRK